MSTFCERSDESANLTLSAKPKGRVTEPRGKTKMFPRTQCPQDGEVKSRKLQKMMKNDRSIKK